ncbi:MAG TPA: winged helix-turn-helix transcriptional regulator [Candidatus Cloacimonadota bacterium]|nr:winged helix-turn-helix transcriptional regulator [Candidatus Cloacimonadota bacterium]
MNRDETTIETISAPDGETINETINETIKLTAIQKDILREITSNPAATYEEIGEKLGVYRATVARHLNLLKKTGVISRMGSRKTGYWHVNNEKHVDQ